MVVVVRINVNSGTSGEMVGGGTWACVAPSILIFSFFFNKSLRGMFAINGSFVGLRLRRAAVKGVPRLDKTANDCKRDYYWILNVVLYLLSTREEIIRRSIVAVRQAQAVES